MKQTWDRLLNRFNCSGASSGNRLSHGLGFLSLIEKGVFSAERRISKTQTEDIRYPNSSLKLKPRMSSWEFLLRLFCSSDRIPAFLATNPLFFFFSIQSLGYYFSFSTLFEPANSFAEMEEGCLMPKQPQTKDGLLCALGISFRLGSDFTPIPPLNLGESNLGVHAAQRLRINFFFESL